MDYKEKYNAALERARQFSEHPLLEDSANIVEYIFPELAESEDDRIRKEIVDFITSSNKYGTNERCEAWLNWLEKQSEKIPNFKIGDWIVIKENTYQITEIDNSHVVLSWNGRECNFGLNVLIVAHLWTIADAKDGDVLVNGSNIFIFHFLNDTRLMGYCHVNTDNGRFYDDIGKNECFCLIDAVVNPATKEQRDLLFAKMRDSWYEWDAEKKELKKIEVASKKSDGEQMIERLKSCVYASDLTIEGRNELITWLEKQKEPEDKGEISDGYHTFNELYRYRMLYNAAFFNMLPKEIVHKSKRHHDGEECFGGGWFIVMANLPTGQISNHYELKDWDLFQIPEKYTADEWDGHTPQEAADRLYKFLSENKEQFNREALAKGFLRQISTSIMNWLDANTAKGEMCLSNWECEDIETAVRNADWNKVYAYMKKKLDGRNRKNHIFIDADKLIEKFAHSKIKDYGTPNRSEVDAYRRGVKDTMESVYERIKSS